MAYYAAMRTYNQKGVTIPSQIRYIHYFERYLRQGYAGDTTLRMKKVLLHRIPKVDHPSGIRFSLIMNKQTVFTHKGIDKKVIREAQKRNHPLVYECDDVAVCRDVKIVFDEKKGGIGGTNHELLFAFWFNTAFIVDNRLVLQQPELDRANKDRNNKIFPAGFKIEVIFESHPDGTNAASTYQSSSPVVTNKAQSSSSSSPSSGAASSSSSSSSSSATPSSPRSGRPTTPRSLPKGRRPTANARAHSQRRDHSSILTQFPSLQNL
jgi:phosphatidylinositol-3,4,5-trisphosphate 3-phosphatase and dual-specificity protein phosphatase PTEN